MANGRSFKRNQLKAQGRLWSKKPRRKTEAVPIVASTRGRGRMRNRKPA